MGKVVSLTRKTFNECNARGVRTKLEGLSMINASMLKGGWYEKRASDLTLKRGLASQSEKENGGSLPLDGGYGELKQVLDRCKM